MRILGKVYLFNVCFWPDLDVAVKMQITYNKRKYSEQFSVALQIGRKARC